jgi:hypothetical protein
MFNICFDVNSNKLTKLVNLSSKHCFLPNIQVINNNHNNNKTNPQIATQTNIIIFHFLVPMTSWRKISSSLPSNQKAKDVSRRYALHRRGDFP